MTHTVVGLFDNRTKAQAAAQELIQKGFMRENIDVSNRRISEADPGSTQVTITEPTISDDIKNFFSSLFGNDKTNAKNYTNAAGNADAVLCIQVDSMERARQAVKILDWHGAIDVDGHSSQHNQQNLAGNYPPAGIPQNTANIQAQTTIPVIEENLQLDKQVVEQGGARIRSRIIEKPVEANLRLREEHVVINRRPVNREATNADLTNFKEEEFVLTEYAEVPVVGKQARVVEEVVIDKNVTEHVETVRETVRRTDVEVEKIDNDVYDDSSNITTRRAAS